MSESSDIKVSRIWNACDVSLEFPSGLSFFEHHLQFFVKEILEIGGEAYLSRTDGGDVSGLFIYDDYEKTGTIFTRSRQVFDYFYGLKPSGTLFAEMMTEHECETYDIYTAELEKLPILHVFKHEVEIVEVEQADAILRFMLPNHPRMNRHWVKVALRDGEKCFIVRLGEETAGLGWVSLVNSVGRLHSLFVTPQCRRLGIGEDILFARLLWLKSRHARSAFSEIGRDNIPSIKIALKGQMRVSEQVYQYFNQKSETKTGPEILVRTV